MHPHGQFSCDKQSEFQAIANFKCRCKTLRLFIKTGMLRLLLYRTLPLGGLATFILRGSSYHLEKPSPFKVPRSQSVSSCHMNNDSFWWLESSNPQVTEDETKSMCHKQTTSPVGSASDTAVSTMVAVMVNCRGEGFCGRQPRFSGQRLQWFLWGGNKTCMWSWEGDASQTQPSNLDSLLILLSSESLTWRRSM